MTWCFDKVWHMVNASQMLLLSLFSSTISDSPPRPPSQGQLKKHNLPFPDTHPWKCRIVSIRPRVSSLAPCLSLGFLLPVQGQALAEECTTDQTQSRPCGVIRPFCGTPPLLGTSLPQPPHLLDVLLAVLGQGPWGQECWRGFLAQGNSLP